LRVGPLIVDFAEVFADEAEPAAEDGAGELRGAFEAFLRAAMVVLY
jgi:hypothetical protein